MSTKLDNEWKFIQSEIHKERPSKKNSIKRELLFTLQILLSKLYDKRQSGIQTEIYKKTKEFYLSL